MKRTRFKEEQTIGILKEAEAGCQRRLPEARHQRAVLLPLEIEVRRHGGSDAKRQKVRRRRTGA